MHPSLCDFLGAVPGTVECSVRDLMTKCEWISSWEFRHSSLPPPFTSSAAPVSGSLTSAALESLSYLPVSTQAVACPGQVPGAASQGRFSAHQPPLVWRRPVSSGEGGRDVYTPGQSPKEQADQVSPHTLDLPQLHPKILSACKSGYCLHKSSFCLPSPPARRYRPGQSRG